MFPLRKTQYFKVLTVNLLRSGRISLPDSENLDSIAAEEDCTENKSLTTMPNILNLKRFVFLVHS